MADRIVIIDNNSNNGKSIAICDSNSAAGTYNNSPASIMRSSNNNKATAACSSNELAKTCNNKPTNTIQSSHSRDGETVIRNLKEMRAMASVKATNT